MTKTMIANLYHAIRVQASVAVAISSTEWAEVGNVFLQHVRIPFETEMWKETRYELVLFYI